MTSLSLLRNTNICSNYKTLKYQHVCLPLLRASLVFAVSHLSLYFTFHQEVFRMGDKLGFQGGIMDRYRAGIVTHFEAQ